MSRALLGREARWLRAGLCAGILAVLLLLALQRSAGRAGLPGLPCGFHAVSGLPCLFCGGTRAARAFLHGDFARAFYLNPLAYPAVLIMVFACLVLLAEAVGGRVLAPWEFLFRQLNRGVPVFLGLAIVLWVVHVCLALKTPKPELVDFRNPVAAGAKVLLERTGH